MEIGKYEINQTNERRYWFISTGRNGHIAKVVDFQETIEINVFNLAMGDFINGKIDYENVTDNGDAIQVLATIATIVEHYTSFFHGHSIFITGDTPVKTRLYQMHILHNLDEIQKSGYLVKGYWYGEFPEPFIKSKNYIAFLVKRAN